MLRAVTYQKLEKKLHQFLEGESPYFVFPQDSLHKRNLEEIKLEHLDSEKSGALLKTTSTLRLHAVRNILGGYITAYSSENEGTVIREVTPKIQSQIGSQGAKHLPYHTDMAYLGFMEEKHSSKSRAPDYLALTCIRNEEKVGTSILDIEKIKKELGKEFGNLKRPWYSFKSPDSVSPTKVYRGKPIAIQNTNKQDLIRWENCLPSRLEGANTFSLLYNFQRDIDVGKQITLKPGETLVFNNRRCLHGRKAIQTMKKVPFPRWLRRVYINNLPEPPGQHKGKPYYLQEG